MSEQIENPVKAFGLHVAHVGINAASPEEAQQVADLFQALMGLEPNVTPVSVFARRTLAPLTPMAPQSSSTSSARSRASPSTSARTRT